MECFHPLHDVFQFTRGLLYFLIFSMMQTVNVPHIQHSTAFSIYMQIATLQNAFTLEKSKNNVRKRCCNKKD